MHSMMSAFAAASSGRGGSGERVRARARISLVNASYSAIRSRSNASIAFELIVCVARERIRGCLRRDCTATPQQRERLVPVDVFVVAQPEQAHDVLVALEQQADGLVQAVNDDGELVCLESPVLPPLSEAPMA